MAAFSILIFTVAANRKVFVTKVVTGLVDTAQLNEKGRKILPFYFIETHQTR